MSNPAPSPARRAILADPLGAAARLWCGVAVAGQAAFIGFILLFYGVRTATGNLAGWNDKPLIEGYVAGDRVGNGMFALHVLLASLVTLCGLVQLSPGMRRRWPALHRWSGRAFILAGGVAALSGAWLTLVRGSYLSTVSAAAVVLNGVLILAFAGLAWRAALQRRFEAHRRWALRTFMVISGVWFLRVGLMGWVLLNQGPRGMTDDMSGPADVVLTFGSYLIPLAVLEVYLRAQGSERRAAKIAAAAVVTAAAAFTAIGVMGTILVLWGPYVWGPNR